MPGRTTTNRWTPAGLKQVMVEGGFPESEIEVFGWGNKACAKAHMAAQCTPTAYGATSATTRNTR